MGVVIEIQEVRKQRRRQQQLALTQRCIEILELNIEYYRWLYENATLGERSLYAHRVQQLSALRDYAVRVQ